MTLVEKIFALYPELKDKRLMSYGILVVNNNDGSPEFIGEWEHPTLPCPTQEQLDGVTQ
jgi:hypothetical protein